jgi:iron(II)-dependent oxidoreductase
MYGESKPEAPHATLRQDFEDCRSTTLALFAGVDDEAFRHSIDPAFSPIGWHLGHIVYTEATWLIRECSGLALPFPELEPIFAVDGIEKRERGNIPGAAEVLAYAEAVRSQMLTCLDDAPLDEQERLWRFVLQHECQHLETVRLLIACRDGWDAAGSGKNLKSNTPMVPFDWISFPAGMADIGLDTPEAMDNERPRHRQRVEGFDLARLPVTQGQFACFMAEGGYQHREFWSESGWNWRESEEIKRPLHWCDGAPEKPVCGISAYEADAFCTWSGTRLPSEFEWEYAARRAGLTAVDGHHGGQDGGTRDAVLTEEIHPASDQPVDMLGNVWEWTASVFEGYEGFQPFPYEGYSQDWFDGDHRVLRGGSWATERWAMRSTFRNWYQPHIRQIFSGLRVIRVTQK